MRDLRQPGIRRARFGEGGGTAPHPRRGGTRRAVLACLLALLVVTATAQAQDNPHATVEEHATTSDLDTDVTPVAKEPEPGEELWSLVHGAEFPDTEVIAGSVTRFDTDLHAVSFRNPTIGLAGGTTCAIEPVQQSSEDDKTFGARVAACEGTDETRVPRVPTLYRYSEPLSADPLWERLELPGGNEPGYIGAIAWIDADRALIVGGTGTYPRRELGPSDQDQYGRSNAIADPTDPDKADVAGEARAWLYARATGKARELDLSTLTADEPNRAGMRGLTALDCFVDPDPKLGEPKLDLCFAGALGQVWEWRGEAFNGVRLDAQSQDPELTNARLFRYRVREIRFTGAEPDLSRSDEAGNNPLIATALTAGCCSAEETQNTPRALSYFFRARRASSNERVPRWFGDESLPVPNPVCCGISDPSQPVRESTPREVDDRRANTNDRPDLPDSWYSLDVRTPGGPLPPSGSEQPSVITKGSTGMTLSTTRLLDGDGDIGGLDARRPSGGWVGNANPSTPDGIPDWVVGELGSTARAGLGRQGVFVATALPTRAQDALNQGGSSTCATFVVRYCAPSAEELTSGWDPVSEENLDAYIRSRHYLLPSYTANAVEIVGKQEDGWMVGDHGAILRLSEAGRQTGGSATEPKPPHLGAPRRKSLSDRSAYEDSRPELPSTAGVVPPLGTETTKLPESQMVPSGSPGFSVDHLVMSRDGSEGWAIGNAFGGGPRFAYFDGAVWTECYPRGVEGELEPDPACKAMAPLLGYRDQSGSLVTANLTHATRVPLENDPDPTNDDELEIIAVGANYTGPETGGETVPATVRYSEGRWSFVEPDSGLVAPGAGQLAFTGPDDGWLLADGGAVGGTALKHFNGRRWIDCQAEPAACGDGGQIVRRSGAPGDVPLVGLAAAGERVYLYGRRSLGETCPIAAAPYICTGRLVPFILYHDRGGEWTDGSEDGGDDGGFDPAFADPGTLESGKVHSLSVVEGAAGFEGWAVGEFGGAEVRAGGGSAGTTPPETVLMRLHPSAGEGWQRFESPGSLEDYLFPATGPRYAPSRPALSQVTYASERAGNGAYVAVASRVFGFDAARERFEMLDSSRPQGTTQNLQLFAAGPEGSLDAMAPDGKGGFWAAVDNSGTSHLFHYTDTPPKPVFEETANPLGSRNTELRALTGAPDGSVWAATDSDRVFRYDRLTGWEEARIGWDPGRVVTRTSQASAIAVGPNGEGLVVGEAGRIAELSATGVVLDAAAGRSCALNDAAPCSTGRDLSAVDVAPDGSALAGGEGLSLLWRPANGEFRVAEKPSIGSSTEITAISMPTPTRAYLATDRGLVFRGILAGQSWSWRAESTNAGGDPIAIGPLNDVAVDARGHGYAVGQSGIIERTGEGAWRRLARRYGGASSVELPETGGPGVLIGSERGRILTGTGPELRVARHDEFDGAGTVGFAYLPGSAPGSVDAWAGIAGGKGRSRILRYRSDPDDPLLDPTRATPALPDAPPHTDAELSLGAFGKSDCDNPEDRLCPEMTATTSTNEVILERTVEEFVGMRDGGELDLAIGSGDAADSAGMPGSSVAELDRLGDGPFKLTLNHTQRAGQLKHRLYDELVVNELTDRGVAHFAATGGQDLSESVVCDSESCETTKQFANAGENLSWREAFASQAPPWGDGSDPIETDQDSEIAFEPAPGSEDNSLRIEGQRTDVDGEGTAPEAKAEIGGANTHYAVDAINEEGEAIARIVFVDTSLRSLQASDPLQQPHELAGGQQRFLERMICKEGQQSTFGDGCTRGKDQRAIVVSNTPSYSYGPGALTHTALDGTAFEATMLRYDVDLVISGALGYNGLYYTLAPGVHEPCPAGQYPEAPPSGNTPDCLAGPTGPAEAAEQGLRESPAGQAAPADVTDPASLVSEQGLAGAYPTLIAAGAGGKFGPDGNEPPDGPAGQWHGYSLARLMEDGDIVVEQRPILDWIGLDAPDHAVGPRARLKLNGYGRSPISTTAGEPPWSVCGGSCAFHYEISTPAITHRYDLLLADPDAPWLPCDESDIGCQELHANLSGQGSAAADPAGEEQSSSPDPNPCTPYLCLPARVGVVDDQSGEVRAGDGKYPETFAIAMLSVDEEVATYPLVFKRSPSFVATPAIRSGALPNTAGTRPTAPPPPPPPPGLPQIPQVEIPQIPPPPGIPQLTAAAPPELQPPAPPAPPPPSQQPAPLDLSVAPPGVSISTPTALIQPPTPPVNPAPPGGARREARQRQAAAQKGGAEGDASEETSEAQKMGGDLAQGPHGAGEAMTRLENEARRRRVDRPQASFAVLSASEQPSAWSRGLLYGGGMTLFAFALAAGWTRGRPTPRRQAPHLPAPARSQARIPD